MKNVAIIIGSTRPGRRSPEVAHWLHSQLATSKGVQFTTMDLREVNLPFLDEQKMPAMGQYEQAHTKKWQQLINHYDGIILLFPQYNWGYPAVLKNAIDYLSAEWADKPVAMVTFGGHGGPQAQAAMKLVLTGLHAQQLATNPQLSLNPTASPADYQQQLHHYDFEAALLKQEFEHLLAD
ncbi:NAD(P)H-dependent oxidoreductase [uncultured Limosilactobacillus sp.]|uniref:NADPH-dependent FMN reductase n=1 Tax=uncultured Limosilactobacillus sp. TaxID=2837629 RepID=UPI0025EBB6B8|nr:NAD(P)H-dependent oxidoreductase [uncultured Limosilactobacillus sp.]